MSLTIGSANPFNSYSSRSAPENFSAINSVRNEAIKLISDGLIGENTTVTTRLDFNSITIDYWSEKAQSQWNSIPLWMTHWKVLLSITSNSLMSAKKLLITI